MSRLIWGPWCWLWCQIIKIRKTNALIKLIGFSTSAMLLRPNSKRCVSNPGRKLIVDSFQPSLMRLNLGSLVAYCGINETCYKSKLSKMWRVSDVFTYTHTYMYYVLYNHACWCMIVWEACQLWDFTLNLSRIPEQIDSIFSSFRIAGW